MPCSGTRKSLLLYIVCLAIACFLMIARGVAAENTPLRLSVNKWRVDAGDSYTLSWMESGTVQPMSDFTIEECTDPQFKVKDNYSRYVVRSHRHSFENATAFNHAVRYYRVRARAWVRGDDDQQRDEEVVSNVVRVTLLGTDKSPAPSFADDPEPTPKKSKKNDKDKDKKDDKEDYPAMGRPDFVVVRILLEPPRPKVGQPFRVRVSVRNVGVVPSEVCQVKVEVAGRQWILDCEPLKPAYAVDVVTPPVSVDTAGDVKVHVEIDPFERIAESRKDNNTKDQSFPVAADGIKPSNNGGTGGANADNGGK